VFTIKIVATVCVVGLLALGISALAVGRILVPVLGLRKLPRPRWWGAGAVMACAGGLVCLWVGPRYGYGPAMLGVGFVSLARRPHPPKQETEAPPV